MFLDLAGLELVDRWGATLLGPLEAGLEVCEGVGLVGVSGAGKSLLGQAVAGLLPEGVRASPGRASGVWQGEAGWWRVGWVPQDPQAALHPGLRVSDHLEVLAGSAPGGGGPGRLLELMVQLLLPVDAGFLRRFPGQLSGGQAQRLALVLALAHQPAFLVLDEPTSALDPAGAEAVAGLVARIRRQRGTGFLWITHDPVMLDGLADRILVMCAGRIIEDAGILARPRHPCAARLLALAGAAPSPGFGEGPAPCAGGCRSRHPGAWVSGK